MIKVIAQTRANKRKNVLDAQMKRLLDNRDELYRIENIIAERRTAGADWKEILVYETRATLLRSQLGNKLSRFQG